MYVVLKSIAAKSYAQRESVKVIAWLRANATSLVVLALVIISCYFAIESIGILAQPVMTKQDAEYAAQAVSTRPTHVTLPTRVIIPRLELGVDIENATIDVKSNAWPLSDTHAEYANFTPGLGSKKGTMLLYGHHTPRLFWRTNDIKIGDQMVLVDNEGKSWKFELYQQIDVKPEQVGFIYEDVPFRVVMFTCDGWNDQYRRLMYFQPVN